MFCCTLPNIFVISSLHLRNPFSYVSRADELPARFYLRVTHVEEDGFRFWGRPLLEGGESSNGTDNPVLRSDSDLLANLEEMDRKWTEIVQSEVDLFVDNLNTEGEGEGDGKGDNLW